jgi:hypothetical protein
VFASAGEDRLLCVWDLEARGGDAEQAAKRQRSAIPPQMLFQHAGHRAPVRLPGICFSHAAVLSVCWGLA